MGNEETTNDNTTAQPPSTGDHLAALIGDGRPAEPEARREPTASEPPAAEPARPEPTASAPAASRPAEPAPSVPPKYKYRGREYTLDELVQHGLLNDALTTAEQFPHLQKKYQEVLEQARQAQAPAPDRQVPPSLTPEQIRAMYAGQIPQVVQAGFLEGDLAELYPNTVAQMLFHRDLLYDARRAIAEVQAQVAQLTGRTVRGDAQAVLDRTLDALTTRDAIYAPLKEPETRRGFLDYLRRLDPQVARQTPEGGIEFDGEQLARLWVAYQHEAILAAARAAAEAERQRRDDERRRAAGGPGPSARPATPVTTPTHLDTLLEGALPRR